MADNEPEIFLWQAIEQIPGANRNQLVKALRSGEIPTSSKGLPWMVKLSDVQAWSMTPGPKS